MKLPGAAMETVIGSLAFRTSAAPYLVMDQNLHIHAANRAYEEATLQCAGNMVGELMFDVFPDNPNVTDAHAVANLEHSLEDVLRRGSQHRMPLQRYDVRDPVSGRFVRKFWLPVNSPIRDADGRTIAILHHVEDVTHLLGPTALERLLAEPAAGGAGEVADVIARILRDAATRQRQASVKLGQSRLAVERAARSVYTSELRSLKRSLASAKPQVEVSSLRSGHSSGS